MSVADEYKRSHSFFDDATRDPDVPLPGARVDAEFDRAGRSINQLNKALSKIQRDDLTLDNGIIYIRNLSQEVLDLFGMSGLSGVYEPPVTDTDENGNTTIISGGGITFIRQALDFPNSYSGASGRVPVVNESETGLEFTDFPSQEVKFADLTDAPDLADNELGFMRVNAAGDGLEFVVLNIDPEGEYARLDEDNDFGGNTQENQRLGTYSEKVVDLGDIAGPVDIDLANGNIFRANVVGDVIWNLVGSAAIDSANSFSIRLSSVGENLHTWFANASWGYEKILADYGYGRFEQVTQPRSAPDFPDASDLTIAFTLYDDGVMHGFY